MKNLVNNNEKSSKQPRPKSNRKVREHSSSQVHVQMEWLASDQWFWVPMYNTRSFALQTTGLWECCWFGRSKNILLSAGHGNRNSECTWLCPRLEQNHHGSCICMYMHVYVYFTCTASATQDSSARAPVTTDQLKVTDSGHRQRYWPALVLLVCGVQMRGFNKERVLTWSRQRRWLWPGHTGGTETAAACSTGNCTEAGSAPEDKQTNT